MSPVPDRDRLGEYAVKAAHVVLREAGLAPEHVRARRLRAQLDSLEEGDGPTVAFLTPRDWAVHVQWESMIAQGLRLRGAKVRFLTCGGGLEICDRVNVYEGPPMPCRTCTKYVETSLDAHGFDRRPLRDEWLDNDPGDWPELDALSLDELFQVEHDGLPLGSLMSIPVRWFLVRSRIEHEPLAPITARRFLRSARRVATALDAAFDEVKPDTVVLLNGLFFFESIALALCHRRGIDAVTYERGFITDTLLFHRRTPDNLYEIGHVWDRLRARALSPEQEAELDEYLDDRRTGRRTMDKYWVHAQFTSPDRPEHGRLATLFTNLTWDSAVLGQDVAFPSIHDWIRAAVDLFRDRPADELVIRVHPAEVKLAGKQSREPVSEFLREEFPQLPPNVRVIEPTDPTSSYPLMEASDVGLVLTSTTGLELALTGTPVVVAGQTHYRGKGFTIDVDTPEQFRAAVTQALDDPSSVAPDVALARRYAYVFFFEAPIASPGVVEHIPGLARIDIEDLSQLAPGANPAVDRVCDGILGSGDFSPESW